MMKLQSIGGSEDFNTKLPKMINNRLELRQKNTESDDAPSEE